MECGHLFNQVVSLKEEHERLTVVAKLAVLFLIKCFESVSHIRDANFV